jgi:hypothetical protein
MQGQFPGPPRTCGPRPAVRDLRSATCGPRPAVRDQLGPGQSAFGIHRGNAGNALGQYPGTAELQLGPGQSAFRIPRGNSLGPPRTCGPRPAVRDLRSATCGPRPAVRDLRSAPARPGASLPHSQGQRPGMWEVVEPCSTLPPPTSTFPGNEQVMSNSPHEGHPPEIHKTAEISQKYCLLTPSFTPHSDPSTPAKVMKSKESKPIPSRPPAKRTKMGRKSRMNNASTHPGHPVPAPRRGPRPALDYCGHCA